MASPSKENNILSLILEESPMKEWQFGEIVTKAKVTKAVANKWLKKNISNKLLIHIKEYGKFPYYLVGRNNPIYNSQKRIYALEQLHNSGLLPKLISLKGAKTIIIFGSIIKGDWYKNSDIDIFILGNVPNLNKNIYEFKLNRRIELHLVQNKEEIKNIKTGLIKNIANGYLIKGDVQDIIQIQ